MECAADDTNVHAGWRMVTVAVAAPRTWSARVTTHAGKTEDEEGDGTAHSEWVGDDTKMQTRWRVTVAALRTWSGQMRTHAS